MNVASVLTADPPKWGAWSARRLVARKLHDCNECGHVILVGAVYFRRYGRMGESMQPWTYLSCESCERMLRRELVAK
jgi:hypothetical protein